MIQLQQVVYVVITLDLLSQKPVTTVATAVKMLLACSVFSALQEANTKSTGMNTHFLSCWAIFSIIFSQCHKLGIGCQRVTEEVTVTAEMRRLGAFLRVASYTHPAPGRRGLLTRFAITLR